MLVSFYLSMELQCEFLMSDIALILLIQHQKILQVLLEPKAEHIVSFSVKI